MRAQVFLAAAMVASAALAATSAPAVPATSASGSPAAMPLQRKLEAVVRAWSKRLNAGDNAGVARLFTLPATLIQGPYAYRLTTRAEIAEWHSGLPCSGRIQSISFRGNRATAVFRLGNRGSTQCDDPGGLAAARFTIVNGKISVWQQVAVPKQQASA
jgi:hypothetical protein